VQHQHGVAVGGASLVGGDSRTPGAHALEGASRPAVLIKASMTDLEACTGK
jgi:hypothetical protein